MKPQFLIGPFCVFLSCGTISPIVDSGLPILPDAGRIDAGPGSDCLLAVQNCPTGNACMALTAASAVDGKCFSGECSLTDATTCPTSKKCAYVQTSNGPQRSCVAAGANGESAVCATETDCGSMLNCTNLSGTKKCVKYCATGSQCGSNQTCTGVLPIAMRPEFARFCVSDVACNVLVQNCPSGQGCYQNGTVTICFPAGQVAIGATCQTQSTNPSMFCAPGSTCAVSQAGSTTGTCAKNCNLDAGMPNCSTGLCQNVGQAFGVCP
jgi:hypothetical protein